ncbi:hypothetical protein BLAT2472_60166 [Burkholderia latens]
MTFLDFSHSIDLRVANKEADQDPTSIFFTLSLALLTGA